MPRIKEPKGKQHTSRSNAKISKTTTLKRKIKADERVIKSLLKEMSQLQNRFDRITVDLDRREARVARFRNELEILEKNDVKSKKQILHG